jgi:hypothetical protein
MEPEDLTLWQERYLIDRWGNKILKECVQMGISNTEFAAEYKRFLDLKNSDYTAAQFVLYFGAMYLEACLFSGWIKAKDLSEWGLRGAYELDRKGQKKPITKGRVFSPSDVRNIEDRWQASEYPQFVPQKL